jgi:hypothetical protein
MLRIYLDQNKWIDLARAQVGDKQGEPFQDALTIAVSGVELGQLSFPLSSFHYMETYNTKSAKRRRDLATIMIRLARQRSSLRPHTIAGANAILPTELDYALQRRFGRPYEVRHHPVFGEGVAHALGIPNSDLEYFPPPEAGLTDGQKKNLTRIVEELLLSGPPADFPVPGIDTELYKQPSLKFADIEQNLSSRFQTESIDKDTRSRILSAREYIDMLDAFNAALENAGISKEEFEADGLEGFEAFLADIPTRHVNYELLRLLHDNPQMKREKGDLVDLAALSVAIPYCDIVVTEKRWVDLARRVNLDDHYGTHLISDLRELPSLVVSRVQ